MKKTSIKIALQTAFFILLTVAVGYFIKTQGAEVQAMNRHLLNTQPFWILLGVLLTGVFLWLQALMYRHSFWAIGAELPLIVLAVLYLKRNLAALFLPGGGLVSLALFTDEAERAGVPKSKIHFASSLHLLAGLFTVAVIAVPVLAWVALRQGASREWLGLAWLLIMVGALAWLLYSLRKGGLVVKWLQRFAPSLTEAFAELREHPFQQREAWKVVAVSLLVEVVGVVHLWVSMKALGLNADWGTAAVGYVAALLALNTSPFLKGLGATEAALAWALTQQGMALSDALATTLIFRLFEFWVPLLLGLVAFLRGSQGLLLRIAPPALIFVLGMVNIVSAVTPALPERIAELREWLPLGAVQFSNFMVLGIGLLLMFTAVNLFRGMRAAWRSAVVLSALSVLTHLAKGIDYEESLMAAGTLAALLLTQSQYLIRVDRHRSGQMLWVFAALSCVALTYGFVGFYFLDQKMFGLNFTWQQSLGNTLRLLLLLDPPGLTAQTTFAMFFFNSISLAGLLALLTGLVATLLPRIFQNEPEKADFLKAKNLVIRYGRSGLDYFKTYADKQFFFSADLRAFVAYKVAHGYAMVLETPVAEDSEAQRRTLAQFENWCRTGGLQPLYYRVDHSDLPIFGEKKIKKIQVGQEGMVDLNEFSLEGKTAKPLRNAVSRCEREGLLFNIYDAPVQDGVLQKLRSVSDAWLSEGRREVTFSGGVFEEAELKSQTLLTVETAEGRILAFVNLIPDYAPGEATYDLVRRLPNAPSYVMDFLMTQMFAHLKGQGYSRLNLGLAPFSGLENAQTTPEKALRFAAGKLQAFRHYPGLRAFKEKYATAWADKFLIYHSDYDLVAAPRVLLAVERA